MNATKQPTTFQTVVKNVSEQAIFDLRTLIDDCPPMRIENEAEALKEARKHVLSKLIQIQTKIINSL